MGKLLVNKKIIIAAIESGENVLIRWYKATNKGATKMGVLVMPDSLRKGKYAVCNEYNTVYMDNDEVAAMVNATVDERTHYHFRVRTVPLIKALLIRNRLIDYRW